MKSKICSICAILIIIISGCNKPKSESKENEPHKAVIYQVFTRLFGNTNTTNKPWGTIEENGVGKFNDITDKALQELKDLGVTHVWYTGVPHHAVINDYTALGISNDDPDVVKGRAGSPYAVKDYYNVNPDLAVKPANRLEEFRQLVGRTHRNGMKVIIDIVPNHVARRYESISKPEGIQGFGETDDKSVEYSRDNDFYYIPGQPFKVPELLHGYQPLGGDAHPLSDGQFDENPAKWTGNGSRSSQPHFYDWYETVKINFGVKPDGTYDFDRLPEGFDQKTTEEHFDFWRDKDVPESWKKFRDIVLFWTDFGVDGFRFDMAEMVPVEFWSYLNSAIKNKNREAFLLAEVYNPMLYREYIQKGKMDYLYDKVELYDTLKNIMQGHGSTDNLDAIQAGVADIEHHMLHFLENHDEQRIASPEFAGDAAKGKPAMVLSATISTSPTMIYFGQEVGEPGAEDVGFGDPSRTSIFDYIGVPHHQRWMNGGKFDSGQLSAEEKELRDFYKRLLNFTLSSKALMGNYREIHSYNRTNTEGYDHRLFSFVRWNGHEKLLIICNLDAVKTYNIGLKIPAEIVKTWNLKQGRIKLTDQLYGQKATLKIDSNSAETSIKLKPLESFVFKIED